MKTNELTFKTKMTQGDLCGLFKSLLKSIEEGALVLETGGKYVALSPAANIDVALEACVKKDKEKLEITLSWENAPCVCKSAALKISSKVPVEPVAEKPVAEGTPAKTADKAPEAKKA